MNDDHADVLALLARCEAVPMPATLEARVLRAASTTPTAEDLPPFERLFDAHRDEVWSFLVATLGDADVAHDALEEAFFRAQRRLDAGGVELDLAAVLGCAREAALATLPLLRKTGHAEHPLGALEDDDRALLLLRASGLSLDDLRRAGAPAKAGSAHDVEAALRDAGAALAAALPVPAHEGAVEQARATLRAALELATPAQRAQVEQHALECAPCAVLRERAREALQVPLRVCPDAAGALARVVARVEKDRAHRAAVESVAARVSIACAYCHAPMLRGESVFCAACLAPHHEDCFRDHGRCSAPGCQATEVVRPGGESVHQRRRRALPWLFVGVGVLGAAALAGASWLDSRRRAAEAAAARVELEVLKLQVAQREASSKQTIAEIEARLEEERRAGSRVQDQMVDVTMQSDRDKRRLLEEKERLLAELARRDHEEKEREAELAARAEDDEARLAGLWRDLQRLARERDKKPEELLAEARQSAEEQLDRDVEALFQEIARAAEAREVERLIETFTRLRELMREAEGRPLFREKLAQWSARLQEYGEVSLSIQLQVFITEGNQLLRGLAAANRAGDAARAEELFASVERLVAEMRAQQRDVFQRNAEAILTRAQPLIDRARLLKAIADVRLELTAVDAAAGRCVVNGESYGAGDVVEGTQVTVVKVAEGSVLFRLGDTNFLRELPGPR